MRGLVGRSVLLTVALVAVTGLLVLLLATRLVSQQVESATDARLRDGARLFQATLDENLADMRLLAEWLGGQPAIAAALRDGRPAPELSRLNLPLNLADIAEASVANRDGQIIAWLVPAGRLAGGRLPPSTPGLAAAAAGQYGTFIGRPPRQPRLVQQVLAPVLDPQVGGVIGVLSLSSSVDAADLDVFRRRSGLDASLFDRAERLLSTTQTGGPLPTSQLDQEAAEHVLSQGGELIGWRDGPVGRRRTLYVPLQGPDVPNVAMLSVSVPESVVADAVGEAVLPVGWLVAALTLAGALGAYTVARSVRGPLLTLAAAAERLQGGDLASPIPPVREPELVPLAAAIEQARTALAEQLRKAEQEQAHQAELSRAREQLLYSLAHELRTPLSILDNALEILAVEGGELDVHEFDHLLGSARRTSQRLRRLMEDLLRLGSIQSGQFAINPRPTPLAEILADAADAVEPLLAERKQRLELRGAREGLLVQADAPYVRQVLVNLVGNASRFGPDRSSIQVAVHDVGSFVRISVSDEGPGIGAQDRATLFQPFFTVQKGNAEPGIGLGLAIARGIVSAHNGTMGLDDAATGACVWFTLPVVHVQARPPAVATAV